MHKYDDPYITDWYAISFRWLILLGLIISMFGEELWDAVWIWPLIVLVIWNIAMTILASLSARVRFHRQISIGIDLMMAGLFYGLQGGVSGPGVWAGILPILTAAVYFEFLGGLIAAGLFSAVEIFVASIGSTTAIETIILKLAPLVVATLVAGFLAGFLNHYLVDHLRKKRLEKLEKEEKKRRIENERLRSIYSLTSSMSESLSYRRILDSVLNLSTSALSPDPDDLSDDKLVSAVLLFRGSQLEIRSARRFTNADLKVALLGEEGLLKKVFDDGEPVLSSDISYDAELGRIIALRSCTSAYCFPLRSGFNIYGALLFAHPEPGFFTSDRTEIIDIIGGQAVVAIQNARLYQDLIEEKERMVEVHEEARKKLARDLHDGPTQSVSAMAMRINLARRMLEKKPEMASEELIKIEDLAQRTTKEIRHMLFTLRPLILESQGLIAALQAMADKMRETYSQNVVVEVEERAANRLEMGKQGVVFYIVEEAVNNARKHAKADSIVCRLKALDTGMLLLEIKDDGVGFDVSSVKKSYDQRGSLGMVNLSERTELLSGLLHIDSAPGKGTSVQVYIPITEEAADRLHQRNK
ncbi:MAG: GAF domain-containing protein [Anaerolineales bacterium]|nr:GAF domain-containing protein [Anaerolineales bacterium]